MKMSCTKVTVKVYMSWRVESTNIKVCDDVLEPVHLDSTLFHSVVDQEGGDLNALITLQLDDLAHLLVFDERAVASEFLVHI